MKQIQPESLRPDPMAAALHESQGEHVVIAAFLCATDDAELTLSMQRGSKDVIKVPRSAVIGIFEEKDEEGLLHFAIQAEAQIKSVTSTPASSIARMRSDAGNCPGASCQSGDGRSSCCCLPGQRCFHNDSTCSCEDASLAGAVSGGMFGGGIFLGGMSAGMMSGGGMSDVGRSASGADRKARLEWPCSTPRGNCPIVCHPIIVNGKIVDYWCFCDCAHPIPYKNALG